jgi:hypothetical protein
VRLECLNNSITRPFKRHETLSMPKARCCDFVVLFYLLVVGGHIIPQINKTQYGLTSQQMHLLTK